MHQPGPAAASRRPVSCALLLLALLVGCGGGELPDWEPARRAARTAIRIGKPIAPQKARHVERLAAAAEEITTEELRKPSWRRDPQRIDAAWARVVRAASELSREIRTAQDRWRLRYEQDVTSAREELRRAEAELREAGMGRRETAAIARARTAIGTAERLAAAGEHEKACEKLAVASEAAALVHHAWSSLHARFSDAGLRRQWRRWVEDTLEESRVRGEHAIVVDKLKRRLTLYYRGLPMLTFRAELGANGLRRKEHAGDKATPEGRYRITEMRGPRRTSFYKALLINYPNDEDRSRYSRGKQTGTIPRRAGIGSLIEIHGEGGQGQDWTDGCVALTNEDMDRLFARVQVGTPVTIVGTHGD